MTKKIIIGVFVLFCIICIYIINFKINNNILPIPEVSSGLRGELGIDKNINENNIDEYLGREDSVYRDVRMLIDDAQYENIGGDSYLSGFISGFEIIPYPFLAPISDLPEEVGDYYHGETLFRMNEENEYIANYEESLEILEYIFPKNKNIFLMCGGGGYAGMTKKLLISLGWDKNKIYNIGGYWYYNGNNNVNVKNIGQDKIVTYDFWKIPYHDINFNNLHEVS